VRLWIWLQLLDAGRAIVGILVVVVVVVFVVVVVVELGITETH